MRSSTVRAWVVVAAGAALLTGCTSSPAPDATPTVTAQPSSSTVTSPTATATAVQASTGASASATPAARTDPDAPPQQCADSRLAVSVQDDPTGSGAGQRLSYVVFRNTGPSACALRGAPGVSLVGDGNGTQIGAAAARSSSTSTVMIQPGSYALAALSYPNIDAHGGAYGDGEGHDPQCEAKAVDGYRVYPPHSFRAFFTRVPDLYGCSTTLQTLHVSAVAPPSTYADFTPRP